MVQIGKRMKYDQYGRITLPSELAELLDLDKGDYVKWYVENGSVVLRKETKLYMNKYDFESEDIKQRLTEYEEDHCGECPDDDMDPEEREALARRQYEEDMAEKRSHRNEN